MSTTINSPELGISELYVGRIAYGTDEIASELGMLGVPILTEDDNLVMPVVRQGRLPVTPSDNPLAERVVTSLERQGIDEPVAAIIGDPYIEGLDKGVDVTRVRANLGGGALLALIDEADAVNVLLARWHVDKVPLHPTILATSEPVPTADAHAVAEVLSWYRGVAVTLGKPAVLGTKA